MEKLRLSLWVYITISLWVYITPFYCVGLHYNFLFSGFSFYHFLFCWFSIAQQLLFSLVQELSCLEGGSLCRLKRYSLCRLHLSDCQHPWPFLAKLFQADCGICDHSCFYASKFFPKAATSPSNSFCFFFNIFGICSLFFQAFFQATGKCANLFHPLVFVFFCKPPKLFPSS